MRAFVPPVPSLLALLTSVAANLILFVALGTGFTPVPAAQVSVIELPSVTVHGQRRSASESLVAAATKKITLASDDKL
jgi:hypothetical protein